MEFQDWNIVGNDSLAFCKNGNTLPLPLEVKFSEQWKHHKLGKYTMLSQFDAMSYYFPIYEFSISQILRNVQVTTPSA